MRYAEGAEWWLNTTVDGRLPIAEALAIEGLRRLTRRLLSVANIRHAVYCRLAPPHVIGHYAPS